MSSSSFEVSSGFEKPDENASTKSKEPEIIFNFDHFVNLNFIIK